MTMPLPHNWTLDDLLVLSLARVKGPALRHIVDTTPSLEEAMAQHPEALAAHGLSNDSLFATDTLSALRQRAQQQQERCSRAGVDIVTIWHEKYPALLKDIFYPPPVLYVRGALQEPEAVAVSIVGTRKCTSYGKLTTERFAEQFARSGLVVVSGLAFGVDTAAHKATLAAGGKTYAVIASGIDTISPHLSARLARDINESGGAVISEYPCGTRALPAYFPQRNRIISGIARATVVVESRERGGALITARFAIDQQRHLFAIPGTITSEHSRGTNLLLQRDEAALALSPDDVLLALGIKNLTSAESQQVLPVALSPAEQNVYDHLGYEPLHIDSLAERCGTPGYELLVILLELEFKGAVRQLPGKQFVKT
jgi:DNA processing protein